MKSFQMKKIYIQFVEYLINEELISSRVFQKLFFDNVLTIFGTINVPSFQLRFIDMILPKIYRLVTDKQNLIDKIKQCLHLLKLKHVQNLQFNPRELNQMTKQ